MTVLDILLLAVALSMDAFAVAVCKGLAQSHMTKKNAVIVGLWFGGFQALMLLSGYLIGYLFERFIDRYVPWIAFALLFLIGVNMIRESLSHEQEKANASLSVSVMLPLAVATSIDALASGVTFVMLSPTLVTVAVLSIGAVTFVLSAAGVYIGHLFGTKYKAKAEFVGGTILILLGLKILLSHYEIIHF